MANVSEIAAKLHEFKERVLALIAHVEAGVSHLNEDQTEEAVKQLDVIKQKAAELRDDTVTLLKQDEAADAKAAADAQAKVIKDQAEAAGSGTERSYDGSGTERYPEYATWADVGDGSEAPGFGRLVELAPAPAAFVEPTPIIEPQGVSMGFETHGGPLTGGHPVPELDNPTEVAHEEPTE